MDGIALFAKAITLFLVLEDGLSPRSLSGLLLHCTRFFGGSERKEPQVPKLSKPFSTSCSGLCSGFFFWSTDVFDRCYKLCSPNSHCVFLTSVAKGPTFSICSFYFLKKILSFPFSVSPDREESRRWIIIPELQQATNQQAFSPSPTIKKPVSFFAAGREETGKAAPAETESIVYPDMSINQGHNTKGGRGSLPRKLPRCFPGPNQLRNTFFPKRTIFRCTSERVMSSSTLGIFKCPQTRRRESLLQEFQRAEPNKEICRICTGDFFARKRCLGKESLPIYPKRRKVLIKNTLFNKVQYLLVKHRYVTKKNDLWYSEQPPVTMHHPAANERRRESCT